MGVGNGQNSVGSRCATPLSRQNSMSMEDFTTSMPALGSANGPRGGPGGDRVTSSAHFSRRSNPGSPRKSVSIDSLHQHAQVGKVKTLMRGSSHIRSVLIGVEYRNCCQTLDAYLLFAILLGQIKSKLPHPKSK